VVEIVDVARSFGDEVVLAGVDLTVARGEVALVVGENGAGKSTLLDIVAGVLAPTRGAIRVQGRPVHEARARRSIGHAPAAPVLPEGLFLHEWLDLAAGLRGVRSAPPIDAAVRRFGLVEASGTRLAALSLGQRRRTALAIASLGAPALLLLDEPTVGLDDDGLAVLHRWLEEHLARGGAILLASHEAALGRRLGARTHRLAAGRLSAPGPDAREHGRGL
jgi:ABC-type multidrug transport system ATPase subunit